MTADNSFKIGLWSAVAIAISGAVYGVYLGPKHHNAVYKKSLEPLCARVVDQTYEHVLRSVPEYKSSGVVSESFSNETVKIDSKYVLGLRRQDSTKIAVSVLDGSQGRSKDGLQKILDDGDVVCFAKGNTHPHINKKTFSGETYFHEDTRFGSKRADRITVMPKDYTVQQALESQMQQYLLETENKATPQDNRHVFR